MSCHGTHVVVIKIRKAAGGMDKPNLQSAPCPVIRGQELAISNGTAASTPAYNRYKPREPEESTP
jgi:hypothetical protein